MNVCFIAVEDSCKSFSPLSFFCHFISLNKSSLREKKSETCKTMIDEKQPTNLIGNMWWAGEGTHLVMKESKQPKKFPYTGNM